MLLKQIICPPREVPLHFRKPPPFFFLESFQFNVCIITGKWTEVSTSNIVWNLGSLKTEIRISLLQMQNVLEILVCKATLVLYLLQGFQLILAGHLIAILKVQYIYAVKMIKHLLL